MIRQNLIALSAIALLVCWLPAVASERVDDVDADGVTDAADGCPARAEVRNGFLDDDGCPDTLAVRVQGLLTAGETGGAVDALVTIIGPGSTSEISARGSFVWSAPRAGLYRMSIAARGYLAQVHYFLLTPGESLVMEVKLQPAS